MAKKAARSRTASRPSILASAPTPPISAPAPSREPIDAAALPSGVLIALELGGVWPEPKTLVALGAEHSVRRVLVQHEGEAPLAFADRVTQNLDALFGRGVSLGGLALACNERTDASADQGRRSLIGLALGAMAKGRAGQVILTAAAGCGSRLREHLTALADDSRTEWRSAGLEVGVELGCRPASATGPRARVA